MKALFDFECDECGMLTEEYIDNEIKEIPCKCGGTKKKMLSAPSYFKIDGFRADIMSDKWAKTRIDNARRHKEQNGD